MTLEQFFAENREVAVAFSGGVDSAYLLYAATRYAARVKAYYVNTAFQPEFELADARLLADELGADMLVLHVDVLFQQCGHGEPVRPLLSLQKYAVSANPPGGGKRRLPGAAGRHQRLRRRRRPAGNAGAAGAVGSLSLRECGLTKAEIRRLSREAGLFTWDKPAYACLATRIRTGEKSRCKS